MKRHGGDKNRLFRLFRLCPGSRVSSIGKHGWRMAGNDRSCRKYPTPSFSTSCKPHGSLFPANKLTELVFEAAFMKLQIILGAAAQHGGLWQPLVNQWQMVFNYQHNSSMVVIICFLLWQIASIYLFISNHKLISKAYCLYLRVPIDKPFLMNGIPRADKPICFLVEELCWLILGRFQVTRLGLCAN